MSTKCASQNQSGGMCKRKPRQRVSMRIDSGQWCDVDLCYSHFDELRQELTDQYYVHGNPGLIVRTWDNGTEQHIEVGASHSILD